MVVAAMVPSPSIEGEEHSPVASLATLVSELSLRAVREASDIPQQVVEVYPVIFAWSHGAVHQPPYRDASALAQDATARGRARTGWRCSSFQGPCDQT